MRNLITIGLITISINSDYPNASIQQPYERTICTTDELVQILDTTQNLPDTQGYNSLFEYVESNRILAYMLGYNTYDLIAKYDAYNKGFTSFDIDYLERYE